jgi:glycogen debranching enzyme
VDDLIQVEDQFYILATATRAAERTAVLQHDDMFAVFDFRGDVGALGPCEQGLYHEGTRHLSLFRLRVNGRRPLLLSARVKDNNELFGADLTNPDIQMADQRLVLMRDIVHLFRARFLWRNTWHERIRLCHYGRTTLSLALAFEIDADFADIFEVRGTSRRRRGTKFEPEHDRQHIMLRYRGLDDEERRTIVQWNGSAADVTTTGAPNVRFDYELTPGTQKLLSFAIRCERGRGRAPALAFDAAQTDLNAHLDQQRECCAVIETSSDGFNGWVRRATADLHMLSATTPYGQYPYAGVPWFSAPFGRDGIITALQTLWLDPHVARDVLSYLSATQATSDRPEQDAEPGKILHEAREGEMATLGEVPFGRYYGSVDATPLFVVLAAAYFERTADRALLDLVLPHVERALDWIDRYGDADGDGFIEYGRRAHGGLVHQGWKDSHDAIFHADGSLAEPPIALCEVQGYVYAARIGAARLFEAAGQDGGRADTLRRQAEQLRQRFEDTFWCEAEGTYALALDGHKQPCRVRTSNAGHCLFGGIAGSERARRVAEQLVGPEMFSGWGIRTVSKIESRYNPMSYHDGSIWPHDNGIIADGFSRYGFDDLLAVPFTALFEASAHMDGRRMPELFCGFHRRQGEGPTSYPVACSPQAWAAGAVFHLVQSCLRLSVDATARRLTVSRPVLPPFMTYLRLRNLALPFGQVDLLFERQPLDIAVTVLQRRGQFEVVIAK